MPNKPAPAVSQLAGEIAARIFKMPLNARLDVHSCMYAAVMSEQETAKLISAALSHPSEGGGQS